jgi:hypothetical protein
MKTLYKFALCSALAMSWAATVRADEPTLPGLEDQAPDESRAAVLKSQQWRDTMRNLERWLKRQDMYSQQQVDQFKRKLTADVNKMSGEELTDYMNTISGKLAVLNSPQGRDAQRYLREQLSLASDEYGAQIRKKIPNIGKMSAEDIEGYLNTFDLRRKQTNTANTMRAEGRVQQAQTLKAMRQQQHDDAQKALDRASEDAANFGGYNSGYNGAPLGFGIPERSYGYGGYRW